MCISPRLYVLHSLKKDQAHAMFKLNFLYVIFVNAWYRIFVRMFYKLYLMKESVLEWNCKWLLNGSQMAMNKVMASSEWGNQHYN
jgi:hypothetical protein